ncbi:hypothetical protein [Streptomyces jumonjinensis]|uniref:Uncharacterized protein n=1 Tax=Streptomyces jumonjinensis TaxID=1945 RepID=A0A646KTD0_STRJU|nr:hypothetical protein [Streptomyces jumonjinensis]MQT05121.1 hypothetical protein [Streptomyces jumonjinensis]
MDDDFAAPNGPVAQLAAEAVSHVKKAHEEQRHQDCANWTFAASWLLNGFWLTDSGEEPVGT